MPNSLRGLKRLKLFRVDLEPGEPGTNPPGNTIYIGADSMVEAAQYATQQSGKSPYRIFEVQDNDGLIIRVGG